MRRGWLAVALLLSLGVNLGLAAAVLLRSRPRAEPRLERGLEIEPGRRLADWLALDGAQRRAFVDAQRRLAASVVVERREIARLRRELRAELLADAPDRARLEALLAELSRRQAALDRAFVDGVVDSRGALSGRALERYLRFVERVGQPESDRPRFRRFGARRGGRPSPGDEVPEGAEGP